MGHLRVDEKSITLPAVEGQRMTRTTCKISNTTLAINSLERPNKHAFREPDRAKPGLVVQRDTNSQQPTQASGSVHAISTIMPINLAHVRVMHITSSQDPIIRPSHSSISPNAAKDATCRLLFGQNQMQVSVDRVL